MDEGLVLELLVDILEVDVELVLVKDARVEEVDNDDVVLVLSSSLRRWKCCMCGRCAGQRCGSGARSCVLKIAVD